MQQLAGLVALVTPYGLDILHTGQLVQPSVLAQPRHGALRQVQPLSDLHIGEPVVAAQRASALGLLGRRSPGTAMRARAAVQQPRRAFKHMATVPARSGASAHSGCFGSDFAALRGDVLDQMSATSRRQ